MTFEEQSLRKALVLVATTRAALQQTLEHVPSESVPRRGDNPRAFKPVGEAVVGKRVLLEVLVLPIARIVDGGFGRVIPAFDRPERRPE